jgi:hypothetical protein
MKKNVLFICVLLCCISTLTFGSLDDFKGFWVNKDSNTGGITKLSISVRGTDVWVHAWGQCSPRDCDWGTVKAIAYVPRPSANLERNANALTAVFRSRFDQNFLVIHLNGRDGLRVTAYDHYTDHSKRMDFYTTYYFKRALVGPGVVPSIPIYSRGSITVRGTYTCDLDKGKISRPDSDFFWEQKTRTERYLVPRNGAKFRVLGKKSFRSISLRDLKKYRYFSSKINGSKSRANRIPTGTVVAAVTNDGRYCKFRIDEYGYELKITYVTYKKK